MGRIYYESGLPHLAARVASTVFGWSPSLLKSFSLPCIFGDGLVTPLGSTGGIPRVGHAPKGVKSWLGMCARGDNALVGRGQSAPSGRKTQRFELANIEEDLLVGRDFLRTHKVVVELEPASVFTRDIQGSAPQTKATRKQRRALEKLCKNDPAEHPDYQPSPEEVNEERQRLLRDFPNVLCRLICVCACGICADALRERAGLFFPRGCLLLVAFSSLALHCGPDFSVSCTLTYRKVMSSTGSVGGPGQKSESHRTTIGMDTDSPSTETSDRGLHVPILRASNYMDWRRRLIGRLGSKDLHLCASRPLSDAAKAVL
ncbi:BQ5605_C064g12796 [Microbotryum silenes-dioicae]|uniref:BQ5605_C021g09224 protein n=1 Tax=Microbotryum silenes-dioicae TaxID=796604 RepID=A0A2X0PQN0_9BASI|nr:BQ5605_C021g09224 [Microbotryum silenes-dioicae]SGZ23531.1 BQ5605_C023g09594 [Microbotryum silenes-dioicae]SGZ35194.1 BQ5605_C064g12796 [Microbotryum silenes-dioicae]